MGEILRKKYFFLKLSHIQLNYAFLLFWNIFGVIHREFIFLVPKVIISESRTELLTKIVFLKIFEKGKILRKIWNCLNNSFWTNQWKGTNIKQICFSPQNEPHTAKLCFLVVLKQFWGNLHRTNLFSKKNDTIRKVHWQIQEICFS